MGDISANRIRMMQEVELDILQQILTIINKHHLKYYMLGGTLLGAVRHQGFIPWDDDIDIGMPRPDYEKFIEYATKELEMPYQVHSILNNTSPYYYYYVRVEDTSKMIVRNFGIKSVRIPVWVDVFPLDGVPENEAAFKKWKTKCNRLLYLFDKSQFIYTTNRKSVAGKKKRRIVAFGKALIAKTKIYKVLNTQMLWNALDKSLKSVDYDQATRLINYCGAWRFKEMFPKSVYGDGKPYQFEGLMLMGPVDYDYVLTQMYGDYMTPPPIEERDRHQIEL